MACVVGVVVLGCDRRDEECADQLQSIREAIRAGHLEQASQALTPELSARCAKHPALSSAEGELAVARLRAHSDSERRSKKALAVKAMLRFLRWTADNLGAPGKAGQGKECRAAGDPEVSFCVSRVVVSDGFRNVSWSERDPAAFKFDSEMFVTGPEVTCADFKARQIRRWLGKNASVLSHCRLDATNDARLEGLHLWIDNPANMRTSLSVFSEAYLKVAPNDFATTLRSGGKTLPMSERDSRSPKVSNHP